MIAAAATEYMIWRSADAVRIETGNGAITLSAAAAAGLGVELLPVPSTPDIRKRYRWTENALSRLAALYKEGATFKQIAQAMGCTAGAATTQITRLGIANRSPENQARGRSRGGPKRRVA